MKTHKIVPRVIITLGLVGLLGLITAFAAPKIGIDLGVASNDVIQNGVKVGDDPVVETTASVLFEKQGIGVTATQIVPFEDDNTFSNRSEFEVTKTWNLSEDGSLYLTAGLGYKIYRGPWDIAAGRVRIAKDFEFSSGKTVLTVYAEELYWYNTQDGTSDNGSLPSIGIETKFQLTDKLQALVSGSATHDEGVGSGAPGQAYTGSVVGKYQFTPRFAATAGVEHTIPGVHNSTIDVREANTTVRGGVSFTW